MDKPIKTFSELYEAMCNLLEMARQDVVIPSIVGETMAERYKKIMAGLTACMKYGVDLDNNPLFDKDNEQAQGVNDSVLQERKYRYFYFHINGFGKNLNPKSKTYFQDFRKELLKSQEHMKQLLIKSKNIPKSTTTKLTTAIGLSIKKNKKYFYAPQFIDTLFNPKNLANYLNIFRTKEHHSSTFAANKREKQYKMGIKDIDDLISSTRDKTAETNLKRKRFNPRKKEYNPREKKFEMAYSLY